MRIGLMSDTHDRLPNVERIVALLNEARVERVVHTGDITRAKTLDALADLEAPLTGVYGNNDVEREALDAAAARHGHTLAEPPLELQWAERRIVVVHDPRDLDPLDPSAFDVALVGHVHRTIDELRDGMRVFNPGECAGHMQGYNRVGVVDLRTLRMELLSF